MTTIVAEGFISRRTAASQSRVDASYSAKLADLSQESSTTSTTPRAAAQPVARERVVFGEIGEFVPGIVHPIDHALVGTRHRAFELEIVRRIGEDEINRGWRKPHHFRDAVTDADRVARSRSRLVERLEDFGRGVWPRRPQYAKPEPGWGGGTLRHARYASTQPLDA